VLHLLIHGMMVGIPMDNYHFYNWEQEDLNIDKMNFNPIGF
jgi:hypothetical protein